MSSQPYMHILDFSLRIRKIREEQNLSLRAFAEKIGVKAPSIEAYEKRGAIPGGDVLLRLSQLTGRSIEWLLTGKEEGETNQAQGGVVEEGAMAWMQLDVEDREILLEVEKLLLAGNGEIRKDLRHFIEVTKRLHAHKRTTRSERGYLPTRRREKVGF